MGEWYGHQWKAGDIVRYAFGETALVRLKTPHAGGWHADHCMGGMTFVCDHGWGERQLSPASESDLVTWARCEKWRKT